MLFRTIDIAQTKGCVDVQTRYKLEFVNDIMGRTSGFDDYDNLLYVLIRAYLLQYIRKFYKIARI